MREATEKAAHGAVARPPAAELRRHQGGEHFVPPEDVVVVGDEDVTGVALSCVFGKARPDALHKRLQIETV